MFICSFICYYLKACSADPASQPDQHKCNLETDFPASKALDFYRFSHNSPIRTAHIASTFDINDDVLHSDIAILELALAIDHGQSKESH